MNCFPCCGPQKNKQSNSKREHGTTTTQEVTSASKAPDMKKQRGDEQMQGDATNINAQNFTFRELATATKNFRQECLLGEGGFGRVYKGVIPATGQAVAVKQLDRHGTENSKDFLSEVALLSHVHHENLVSLIGYCADGEQRLLVYEYYPAYTLEDRLLGNRPDEPPLNWFERMRVAAGASKGLEYLHDNANPPVIFRDLKTFNILLGTENDLNAKLYDFGLAKLCGGDKMNNAPPRVMGTYGYCAPEYTRTGQVSLKSDVYSFGVVLLELITGRRAVDTTKPNEEQNLVSWAQPLFRDPKKYPDMADPLLNKHFPEKDLNQAVAIAAMCLQEEPEARPLIGDVVTALSFLSTAPTEPIPPPSLPAATSRHSTATESEYDSESESEGETSDDEDTDYEEDNETAQNHVAAGEKSQKRATSKKSSRKSSTKSRNETTSKDSAEGSASSSGKTSRKWQSFVGNLSQKSNSSSKKSSIKEISQKSSKKTSIKELCQKSSRKSSNKDLSHKSSRKSSAKVSSRMESEDGSMNSFHRSASSQYTSSSMSSSSRGSGSVRSDVNGSRRTEESMRLAMESGDEGTNPPFDRMSSSDSERR
ncbi:probable serine/threonine-protein kinase PBL25 [Vicia villosa]|uniref:probable serine/threonine-protein kinase PBL25 n=1 Tax=Vicia villosa TaxID=3911 RepID=UPI00273CAFBB|nr:probable serine/threonine-protein kinase PBL25 [Vicia villosa]